MRKIGKSEFELLKNAQVDSGSLAKANRGYFSPSSLGAIVSCGEKFKRRYVQGDPGGPASSNMILGTDVHNLVETFCTIFFRNCEREGILPLQVTASNRSELVPTVEEVLTEYSGGIEADGSIEQFMQVVDLGRIVEEPPSIAQKIYALWHKEMSESLYVPLYSEETFYAAVDDIPLLCKIDLVLLDLATGKQHVVDLKVGHKKRVISSSLQLHMYSAATGIESVGFWQMTPPKIRVGAKSTLYIEEVDRRFMRHVETMILSAERVVAHGTYTHAVPDDWTCSEKWCGYFTECRG
jgi:hypothetical protein